MKWWWFICCWQLSEALRSPDHPPHGADCADGCPDRLEVEGAASGCLRPEGAVGAGQPGGEKRHPDRGIRQPATGRRDQAERCHPRRCREQNAADPAHSSDLSGRFPAAFASARNRISQPHQHWNRGVQRSAGVLLVIAVCDSRRLPPAQAATRYTLPLPTRKVLPSRVQTLRAQDP